MELSKGLTKELKSNFGEIVRAVINGFGGEACRTAIVIKTADGSFIVGKDFIADDEGKISWSWGCYDIPTVGKAMKMAEDWIRG